MGNIHLTSDSRNHVEKQSDNRDIYLSQNATIHSIILKGHIYSGYEPMCLNLHSATPGHASDKPTDCPKIDILPDINQVVGELLDGPGWVWKPPNALIHDVPR